MIQLFFLVSTAVNIVLALHLYRQTAAMRKANEALRGIVKMMQTDLKRAAPDEQGRP